MSSEWRSTTIGDVCSKVFSGGTPTSTNASYYDGGTIPWLRTKEVNYGKIYNTEGHITELGFENSSAKLVPVNSVIVAMYGNGDTAGRVAVNKVPLTTNQACCNLVVDTSKADYRFVYYYLMGQYKALVDLKNGGAQQNLNGQLIKAFPIALPSIEEQVEISTILESLDDRITLLRETNATLEAMAQALFKSWFVDFDPVHAKKVGRTPEGMDEATANLFPDDFEESELGLVPKGWGGDFLGDRLKISYGKNLPTTKLLKNGFPVYGGNGVIGCIDQYLYETRQVLVACRGAASGKFNQTVPRSFVTNNSLILESSPLSNISFGFLKGVISTADLTPFVTGSAQPQVTIDSLKKFKLLIPSPEILRCYESFSSAFEDQIELNNEQIQTLANLRDTLLPRLISGQLRIADADPQLNKEVNS